MAWSDQFTLDQRPDLGQIEAYIASPLWRALCDDLEETYGVEPSVEYSRCSGARGWNVKYKKGSRALCTLYPREGYFICMVSIGRKEAVEAELLLPTFEPYLRTLYQNTNEFNGGRWLMIDVTSEEILENVKALLRLRVKPLRQRARASGASE